VDPLLANHLLARLDDSGLGACKPFVLVQSLHACALLDHAPPVPLATALLAHIRDRMEDLSVSDLSCLLWALATLQMDPGREWVDMALARCEVQVRDFNNGTMLSSTLWALAVMQHAPSGAWMEHFCWQVRV